MKSKFRHIALLGCALMVAGGILLAVNNCNAVFADVTNGYQVFKSTDTTTPVTTVSSLPSAFAYINTNGAADDWIVKVMADDANVGGVATLNASGVTVTLTSNSGVHTLYQPNAGVRHINITAGNLVMDNITLDGSGKGGGVSLGAGASLVLNANGTIQNAKAGQGGGIFCSGAGTVTLNGGSKVANCQSTFAGTGGSGGGIYSSGSVVLNDGALITENIANGGKGGGIAICYGTGSLVMNGGEISNNTVNGVSTDFQGGGVTIYGSGSTFKMYGGKITGNKADLGAGVCLWYTDASSTFTMYGGEISKNDTSFVSGATNYHGYGGGIFAWGWGTTSVDIQGGKIFDNVAREGGGVMTYTTDSRVKVSGDASIYGNQATWGGGIFNEGSESTINDTAGIHDNTANYGGGIYINKGLLSLKGEASVSKNNAISGAGVYARLNFSMSDQSSITGNTSSSRGGGVYARSGFAMDGDSIIKDNVSVEEGGGVLLASAANFNMSGGIITANTAGTLGGGVSSMGPSPQFTMDAAGSPKLYGNIADVGADDFYSNGATTTATLITVGEMNLPLGVHGTNWYYDEDAARYRDAASTKTIYSDSLLSGITNEVKLTIGICYEVAFDSQGGSAVADITGVAPNATIGAPTDPTYKGHTFEGWYTDKDGTVAWDFANDKVTKDMTLYAKWTVNKYDVAFDSQGGSAVDGIVDVPYDTTFAKPEDPAYEGHTFGGWYKDKECTEVWDFANDTMPANDITLYAKWTVNKYDVAFDSQGGSDVDGIVDVPYDTTFAKPGDPTYEGHTFEGWYKDKDYTEVWDFSTDKMPANDITLYAKWTVNKYNVAFDSQGGTAVDGISDVVYDTTFAKPEDPTKLGNTFVGWYKDKECTEVWDFVNDTMPANDITLYAKWTINKYNVTFDSQGGSAVAGIVGVEFDTTFAKPEDPAYTGHTFGGWYKDKECTEVWDFSTDKMPASDITLYAKWTLVNDTDNPGEDRPAFEAPYDEESGPQNGDSEPQTGDSSNPLLWLTGMILATVALGKWAMVVRE